MKTIHTNQAPAAIGPYSQAIQTGNMLFTSGQVPLCPETGWWETPSRNRQHRL